MQKFVRNGILSVGALATLIGVSFELKAADPQPRYKIRWVLAHEPVAAFVKGAKVFADLVDQESHGEMKVEILNASAVSEPGKPVSEQVLFDKLAKGEFEMSQTYTTYLGAHSPQFWALDLPFLFRDHAHATKVLDGKIGQGILASLEPAHMKGLAFTYSGGFRVIPTTNKELRRIEDFRGLRVRVSAYSEVGAETMRELGAIPVSMSPEAGAAAAKDHVVDGLESTYSRWWDLKDRNSDHVLNETGHSLFTTAVVVNREYFDKLPANYQKILRSAALKMAKIEREDSIQGGEEIKAKLASNGFELVQMSEAERARFRKATLPVYEKFDDIVGKDLVHSIQNTY